MADLDTYEPMTPRPVFVPVADVLEIEGALVIRMAVPGVLEEDIDLSFDPEGLVVRGELEEPAIADEARAILREWRYGVFERRFALPEDVDRTSLTIEVEFGVLEVRLVRRAGR